MIAGRSAPARPLFLKMGGRGVSPLFLIVYYIMYYLLKIDNDDDIKIQKNFIDGKLIGKIASGKVYLIVEVEPGTHTFEFNR